ncbi:MAG TPA: class I SAM-dependent methyltransferase [Verrucomicrobiae bacterium]|nr:class I SAM-dependent methyltransferase [Verrucomicrobiae bacterium]
MSATANLFVPEMSAWAEEVELEEPVPGFGYLERQNKLFDPEPNSVSEAIVRHFEPEFNAANGLILHLGAGHGELMYSLQQHGFSVMGCEPASRPTRLARQIHGFDARTLHCCGLESFLNWVRCIGQKAQAIFFRHDWEHNFQMHALLPRMADALNDGGRVIAVLPPPAADYPREAHLSFLNELAVAGASSSASFDMEGVDCDEQFRFMAFVLKKTAAPAQRACRSDL